MKETSIHIVKEQFRKLYGDHPDEVQVYFAPGRVNLIGEHTDYSGGYVMPCALEYGTYLAIRQTGTDVLSFSSGNFSPQVQVSLHEEWKPDPGAWSDYPLGVLDILHKAGHSVEGMEMHFWGDVPQGAGLSSSASIEMATAVAVNTLFGFGLSMTDLARICQKAENQFVGMNCGIMDQFASALGMTDHALFLNCKTLNYVLVPFHLPKHTLVIINTNKPRNLVETAYNQRRLECEIALGSLKKTGRWNFLGELSVEDFLAAEHLIEDDTIAKRAYHVITENKRVLEAAKALHGGDLEYFGQLMYASHESLKQLYEVSCDELDVLVEESAQIRGVLGARMTGGGFGGCTIHLVENEALPSFMEVIDLKYTARTGLKATFYCPSIGKGACRLE